MIRVKVKIIDFDQGYASGTAVLKSAHPTAFRKERGRGKASRLPVMKIGFRSLAENLDRWIEEANKGETV